MYSDMFEKMDIERGNLCPYEGSNSLAFNGTTTLPWGYVELSVSVGDKKDVPEVNLEFLVIPCRSVYNCIL